jgi:hypothetical protein
MLGYYRRGDTKRSLSNDLTEAFIEDTTQGPCAYCGTTEDARGLDRLDNSRGHLKTNVVPCCAICNTARNDNFTPEEFKLIGAAIAQIRKQRNESRTSESEG